MRKIALALLVILAVAGRASAQQKKVLTTANAACVNTSCLSVSVDPGQGGAILTVSANASGNTISFKGSGDGGTTLVALSATPSNSQTTVTSTNGTGSWQVNTAGYTNIYLMMTTLVSGTATVSINQSLPSGRGGSGATVQSASIPTSITTTASNNTTAILTALGQNTTQLSSIYIPNAVSTLSQFQYHATAADNTANVYDVGLYGPNCLNGATNVPLAFHTGAQAGTTLFPSISSVNITLSGAPVGVNMVAGWYCFAWTSSAAAPAATVGGEVATIGTAMFANLAQPQGGTGTTVGGALNATITAPALAETQIQRVWFTAF